MTNASLELSYYRFSNGRLVTCIVALSVASGNAFNVQPANEPSLPDDTQFSVVVRSFGSPVVALVQEIRGQGDARTQKLNYPGIATGAYRVFVPNVTRRFFGYGVPLIVQNLGFGVATVNARFVSFDGIQTQNVALQVAPSQSGVIDPDYTDGLIDGTQYAVMVSSDQPVVVVANAHTESAPPVGYAYIGLAIGAPTLYAPYVAKNIREGRVSPIVVQNLGDSAVDATMTFTPLGGGASQSLILSGIAPGAARDFDPRFVLDTHLPCAIASPTCLANGEYSAVITASGPIGAVVLPVTASTTDAYVAATILATRLFLPVVPRSAQSAGITESTVFVQATRPTNAIVHWFRPGADAEVAQSVLAVPTGSVALDPHAVSSLQDGVTYAAVVDSQEVEMAGVAYLTGGLGDGAMTYLAFVAP